MLTIAVTLAVVLQAPSQARPMSEAERKANADHWERCVNVKEGDDFNAAILSCNALLAPSVPLDTPNRGVVYAKRGVLRARLHLWNLAVEDLTASLAMVPADLRNWVLVERGLARNELKQWAQALPDLNAVIAAEPAGSEDFIRATVGRGINRFLTRDYRRAVTDFDTVIAAKGAVNSHLFYMRALSRGMLGDLSGARSDMAEAVRIEPNIDATMRGYGFELPVVAGLQTGGVSGGVPPADMGAMLYEARLRVEATRGETSAPQRALYTEQGLQLTDKLLRFAPDNVEALVYHSILLRSKATYVVDPALQRSLLDEANAVQARADALMKKR